MAKKRYNFTLDEDVRNKAKKIADGDDRGLSYIVNGLLKSFIHSFKKKKVG